MDEKNFLIIDGNSIMNRAFYGIRLLSTKDGTYTNACYGFLNIYYMILEKINPKYVAVTFDLSAPTFRHKMYNEYKAGRRSMPDELRSQIPLIKEILKAMNIKILELEGYEADDIIGTISKYNDNNGVNTYILTGDRDSFQLISKNTNVIMPLSKMGKTEYTIYNLDKLKEKYLITPKQVIDLKALMGDKSDNIPGIPMIGEKTATSLLEKYNNLDEIYEKIDTLDVSDNLRTKIKDNKEIAYLSYELAKINTSVPLNISLQDFKIKDVDLANLSQIFVRLSFKKFLEKYNIKEDDVTSIETKEAIEFYKSLKDTKFNIIHEAYQLDNILDESDRIFFVFLDDKCNFHKFTNTLLFLSNNEIYVIKLDNFNKNDILKTFCEAMCEKVGYNIKKLLKCYFDEDMRFPTMFKNDIMIAYYLINSTESNYSIENMLYSIVKVVMPELDFKSNKKQEQTNIFDMLDMNNSSEYNFELDDNEKKYIYAFLHGIKECNNILNNKLDEYKLDKLYNDIEIPLIETLAYIESNGMYVDKDMLKHFCIYLDENIDKLKTKIYEISGEEFNINSPVQLGNILYEKLKLPILKKNKTNYSTDKEVLEELEDKNEIIPLILEYRSLTKLKSTYIDGLISNIEKDGRIHTTFMQAVTATGRLSSVEPNLQNIPTRTEIGSKIRECFTVSEHNNKIIDADYSQIELRVLASIANDSNMISAYNNGTDIHAVTASEVFNVPLNEVSKELRSKAKAVNFGIVYGISDYGLSKSIHSTKADAKKYIDNYLNHYTGIASYMRDSIKIGEEKGYVETLFGRRRNLPELKSANYNTRGFGERVAMNMPIQGTAADIMKIAMNNLYKLFKDNNLKSKIIMQVHDELIVEAVSSEVDVVKEYMKNAMQNAVKLSVPLVIDINVGDSWKTAK